VKRLFIVAGVVGMLAGCRARPRESDPPVPVRELSSDQLPPEVRRAVEATAARQSIAARRMTTTVHRAYDYKGYAWHQESPEGKVVAVDVEFAGYSPAFDLDDIDLIDGDTGENYGSNPEVALLRPDGTLPVDEKKEWPAAPNPLRLLLIYSAPRTMKAVKLSYWDQALTPESALLRGTGPTLRPPGHGTKP
jgi:hypothetical protein